MPIFRPEQLLAGQGVVSCGSYGGCGHRQWPGQGAGGILITFRDKEDWAHIIMLVSYDFNNGLEILTKLVFLRYIHAIYMTLKVQA